MTPLRRSWSVTKRQYSSFRVFAVVFGCLRISAQVIEKHASELDLGCHSYTDADWITVREQVKAFLRLPNEEHDFLKELLSLARKSSTDCYIGLCTLGYMAMLFGDAKKRVLAFEKSLFGSVPLHEQIPLAYWDTIASGWPIFGVLELLSIDVKGDGIEPSFLGDRCCDRIDTELDRTFLDALWHHINIGARVSTSVILKYLAGSPARCSWGKASAYFALSENFLHMRTPRMLQAAKEAMTLGEAQLAHCTPGRNATVREQFYSIWPFWSFLRRIEVDMLVKTPTQFLRLPPSYSAPQSTSMFHSHWLPISMPVAPRMSQSGDAGAGVKMAGHGAGGDAAIAKSCDAEGRDVHVALAGDQRHAEGMIAVIYSLTSSTRSPQRVCIHIFCIKSELKWYREALLCSFRKDMHEESGARDFSLAGVALRLEVFEPDDVLTQGLAVDAGVLHEAGDLNTPHNFVRFRLHKWLSTERARRIVYLDTDIIVLGDVCELHDQAPLDGPDVILAAVPRRHLPLSVYLKVMSPKMPMWLPSSAPSFNAGVMVIDNVAWQQANITGAVDDLARINPGRDLWRHGSQPPLLLLLHDRVRWLDGAWNVDGLGHRAELSLEAVATAKILHWTGPLKPWLTGGLHRELWEPFRKHCWQDAKGVDSVSSG